MSAFAARIAVLDPTGGEPMNLLQWLLDSDPSIRWQVMGDLTGEPAEAVAAERTKVATEGWGARLLALQGSNGQWGTDVVPAEDEPPGESLPDVGTRKLLRELDGVSLAELADYLDVDIATLSAWEEGKTDPGDDRIEKYRAVLDWMRSSLGTYNPKWISTTYTLLLLRDMGLDPASDQARRAVALVRDNSKWDEGGQDYFDGEVEPCINGMAVALGAYFGQNVDGIVERLLGEQLGDGGWNCEAERGSTRSSFNTTISVLEGLFEYELASADSPSLTAARLRGQEYLLERRMLRRLSTGEVVDPAWTQFSFPTRWYYDVLRGLDYLRSADAEPDERCAEAVDLVESKRDPDGRWPLENTHPGRVHFDMEEGDGEPSRWNTLRAMRVLAWYGGHAR
jgi:transcriptional regulator with XRE-family HTH domain